MQVTIEDLQKSLPSRKNTITEEIVDLINLSTNEPEFQGESLLQTAVTYENLMTKNKTGLKDYLHAIKFCSYLVSMEDNFTEAYKKTFVFRDFVKDRLGATTTSTEYKELTSAASRYRRSKLVVDILTYSQVPLDILFSGARYKAIGVLADEMENADYSRDRIAAAKELLLAVKGPENMKIELDIGVKENSAVQNLNDQLAQIASRSLMHLQAGSTDIKTLGAMKPTDKETINVKAE